MAGAAVDPLIGREVSHYKLEEKLGQGGMGSVYRAWDSQLRRQVAIKLLTTTPERSPELRARFLMEARSAAALNHPNIVTVYEIGQSDGFDYIAMELVPGKTLRSVIGHRPMPLEDVLSYGTQIADAVTAAHAAGITHRDLKPANVMVSERGRLKVLDFGIAKRRDALEEDRTQTMEALTMPGAAVGTANYMSPEQAQGKAVDGRSDIFALGAILYEMLTGRRAFGGESYAEVMAGILKSEPPPISSIRPVPAELERLIGRCLRKDVERRLQHAGDLKIALDEMSTEARAGGPMRNVGNGADLDTLTLAGPAAPTGLTATMMTAGHTLTTMMAEPASRNWMLVIATLAAALGAGGGWLYWRNRETPRPFAKAELFTVTNGTGLATNPALSRDGKFITYAAEAPGSDSLQIWVKQLSGGAPIQLTTGTADSTEPSFSPDGTKIVFRSDRDGGGIFLVPAFGGEIRLLAKNGRSPRFSPDGKRIAYWEGGIGALARVFLLDLSSDSPPRPFHPEFVVARAPVWSPDGKSIVFAALPKTGRPSTARDWDWWVAPAEGGPASRTGAIAGMDDQGVSTANPSAWMPGDRILFSGSRESATSLWLVNLAGGRVAGLPVRITFGTGTNHQPSFSGEGSHEQVAFADEMKKTGLWMLPVDANRGVVTGPLKVLDDGKTGQLSITADGRRVAYFSDRNGKDEPWIRDLATGRQSVVTSAGMHWQPHISPDGKWIAWTVLDKDRMDRTVRAPLGEDGRAGLPEPLCDKCGPVVSWSPDGKRIVFAYGSPSRSAILEIETGQRYDLFVRQDTDVWGGRFSPDGRWLTMNITPAGGQSQIFIAPFDPERRGPIPVSEWIPLTDGKAWDDKSRWAPDGKSMYFVSERDGFRCIWRQPLDPVTKRPAGEPLAVLHQHQARRSLRNVDIGPLAFQVAPDKLIFNLGEVTGNIWLLKNPE